MTPQPLDAARLISELTAEAVRASVGSVGMLVRDVPEPDPGHLLTKLDLVRRDEGVDLRVAYLRSGGERVIADLGLDATYFSHEIERAEGWRNERALAALIVVVAHGDEAKLSSLAEFTIVTSRDLKRILVERAIGEEAGQTEVLGHWWMLLGGDDGIGLGQLIDYYLALSGKTGNDFIKASSREISLLGLLPDLNLFDDPRQASIKARLRINQDLTRRLQMLTPQDRQKITQSILGEKEPDRKERLQSGLDQLHRTRWGGEGMKGLSLQLAEELVKAPKRRPNGTKRPSEKASEAAARALLDDTAAGQLDGVMTELRKAVDQFDETQLRPQSIRIVPPEGGSETIALARPDVINFMKKLLDEGVYGGLVQVAESPDLEDALRRFNSEWHVIARWDRESVLEFLNYFAEIPEGKGLVDRFLAYDRARSGVLPMIGVLATEPLLAAAHPETRAKLSDLIDKYEALIDFSDRLHGTLFEAYGAEVNDALAHLLLTDTTLVQTAGKTYAILSPTHPLYLWHYVRYSQIVSEQQELLGAKDRELVVQAAGHLPNFLTSVYVPPAAVGTGKSLTYLGKLGSLPYFGEQVESSLAEDGVGAVRSVLETQLALEPFSRHGFRLALVNPPNAGAYLSLLANLADDGLLTGAHLTVYRRPRANESADLRIDEDQEDHVAATFHTLAPGRRFTFDVKPLFERDLAPKDAESFHSIVVFDQSSGKLNQVKPATHPLQPLALPQKLRYR
ncbi:MAG: hypothetical protein AVDCRST_MAG93-6923, partial [uncultured Chloroflexia bacterium]